jgi:glycosyltransferase 2 family protein
LTFWDISKAIMTFEIASSTAPRQFGRSVPILSVHEGDLARADAILALANFCDPQANAALLGDKRFLFSPSGKSFISYGVKGKIWLALGGPIGQLEEANALVQAFLDRAQSARAKPSFYGVGPQFDAFVSAFNFRRLKTGERAILNLETFSLDGKTRQVIRTHRNRHIKQGCTVQVEGPGAVRANLARLTQLSDQWLSYQSGGEKGFGLGRFDVHYIDRLPLATVRLASGEIAAFATLWPTADKSRIGVDLMRYGDDGPNGVMDFLFAEMFLWAKAEGYKIFDLNTSPAAGVMPSWEAPILTSMATLAYKHGEKIYNFQGVRRFKSKFHPDWEDVYMAAPKTSSAFAAAMTAAALINKPT